MLKDPSAPADVVVFAVFASIKQDLLSVFIFADVEAVGKSVLSSMGRLYSCSCCMSSKQLSSSADNLTAMPAHVTFPQYSESELRYGCVCAAHRSQYT